MIITSSLPTKTLSTTEIYQLCDCPVEFQTEKLGIKSRHILDETEKAFDLAVNACKKLFNTHTVHREDIDCLLYVTQTPEKQIPQNSSLLQHALELPASLFALDISLGCSGYVYGLSVAKSLMQTFSFKNTLLVTCDCYSKIIDKNDKNTMAIFGDAATVTYLNNPNTIGIADFGTNGKNAQAIMLDENKILRMNGRAVFEFALKTVKKSVFECLKKNNLSLNEIDYFVFHQANKFMLENIALTLSIPKEKLIIDLENYANTISSSIPLALENLLPQLKEPKKILASGFGVGLSWATTILYL